MDDSTKLSMMQTVCSKENSALSEESGWTSYFNEFFRDNRDCNSSLVSDAASCARLKFSDKDHLSFKKRKTTYASFDEDLEDTASSPANSPKVSDFKHSNMKARNKEENIDHVSSQEENASGICVEMQERGRKGFNKEEENEYTGLKKRGLCLVSLSMLVNYLG